MVAWAAATTLGMFASAQTGIYLLAMLVTKSTAPQAVDILATGLVIGGGTKPLHDLITRVQAAKEKSQDPAEAT
jgi:hypothetical protein